MSADRPPKRVPIPQDIAAAVLFHSDRICCVCRTPGKKIQIHHIDDDPSNNQAMNLAVLCLECHGDTQLSGGFGRKLDANQVRLYRDDWYELVSGRRVGNPQGTTLLNDIEVQLARPTSRLEIEDLDVRYVFVPGRIPDAYYVRSRIRALTPPVDTYVTTILYTGSSDVLDVAVTRGGRVRRELATTPLGFRRFEIDLERTLNQGDEHVIEEVCRIGGRGHPPQPFLFHSVEAPTRKLTLRVQFAERELPASVFRLSGLAARFGNANSPLEQVLIDRTSVAEATFDQPEVGWIYALTWEWE
jgi:hypothetical protein